MSLTRKFFSNAVAPAVLVFGLAAGANAGGLEPGKCYAKSQAEAVLKAEGQFPIIIGNRLTEGRNVNIFFTNNEGYGYNLEGDKPNGIPSNKVCVVASYKDVHLNDIRNAEIPSWGRNIKANDGADVKKAYAHGARLIFAAQTYENKADGREQLGKYMMVLASPLDKGADAWSVDSQGYPTGGYSMVDFGMTPKMQEMISSGQRAAVSTPDVLALAKR